MATWNPTELQTIGAAREVEVSSLREDGTLTKPETIWAVRVEHEYGYPSSPVDSITTDEAKATTIRVIPR